MIHETVMAVTNAHIVLSQAAPVAAFQPVFADNITDGFAFVKDDGKIIGPILLAGSGAGALLLRVMHYNHAGDYIRNILIAAPIAGTLLTGGSLWLNLFGKVG